MAQESKPDPAAGSTEKQKLPQSNLIRAAVIAAAITALSAGLYFLASKAELPVSKISPLHIPALTKSGGRAQPKPTQKKIRQVDSAKDLTEEERRIIHWVPEAAVPRTLTEDEKAILNKRVDSPAGTLEEPALATWSEADFESHLEEAQNKRKIYFGWFYQRDLSNLFKKNYLAAVESLEKGGYAEARTLFLNALDLPVYRNDLQKHRAVALVMLRPYMNDVIGKIAVLNQFLLKQTLTSEGQKIYASYEALFEAFKARNWEKASDLTDAVKGQISAFESDAAGHPLNYPPVFGKLDEEVRNAILAEATPHAESALNFKALHIDLNLKQQVVSQNTAAALAEIERSFSQAQEKIQAADWDAARSILRGIDHPPELAEAAKKKIAVIDKIIALEQQE